MLSLNKGNTFSTFDKANDISLIKKSIRLDLNNLKKEGVIFYDINSFYAFIIKVLISLLLLRIKLLPSNKPYIKYK